jgi:hypothetical protein
MALVLNDHKTVTNIKVLTHRKNDLVPYDRLIFVNAKYLMASLLGEKHISSK